MPTDERIGTNHYEDPQDRREPTIKLDKEHAMIVRCPGPAAYLTLQNDQLMPERRILSFKSAIRLEGQGQDCKHKA